MSKEVNWKTNGSVLDLSPYQGTTRYYGGGKKAASFFLFSLANLTNKTEMLKLFHTLLGSLIPSCVISCRCCSNGLVGVETDTHVHLWEHSISIWQVGRTQHKTFDTWREEVLESSGCQKSTPLSLHRRVSAHLWFGVLVHQFIVLSQVYFLVYSKWSKSNLQGENCKPYLLRFFGVT